MHRSTTTGRAVLAAAVATLALLTAACTPPPAGPPAGPGLSALTGPVNGWLHHGADTCPAGQSARRILSMDVDGTQPSKLVVDVCSVNSSGMGGAWAVGGFELSTATGSLSGTANGSWTWSYQDILNADLQIHAATGTLRGTTGTLHLTANVERFDPVGAISGSLSRS